MELFMEKMTTLALEKSKIIHQEKIPSIKNIKALHHHPILKKILPNNKKITVSWISYQKDYNSPIKTELLPTLIYIYHGSANLVGTTPKSISAGDILLIPENYKYGFRKISKDGLQGIRIQFDRKTFGKINASIDNYKSYALTFDGLLLHNQLRLKETLNNDFFHLLKDNSRLTYHKKQRFLDCVQVFSDYFQIIMFSREATCKDKVYIPLFLRHLQEEFGHNELLATRKNKHAIKDPILHASSSWFCYQMFVLDNIEKTALIHLILETGGSYYGNWAKQKVGKDVHSNYFDIHGEGDDEHAEMGKKLLKGQDSHTYQRLHQVIDKGWEMLNIMLNRIAFLTNQED
jgi:hypothetical protein